MNNNNDDHDVQLQQFSMMLAQEENKKPDVNANKFIPNIIRLNRDHCNMVSQF